MGRDTVEQLLKYEDREMVCTKELVAQRALTLKCLAAWCITWTAPLEFCRDFGQSQTHLQCYEGDVLASTKRNG